MPQPLVPTGPADFLRDDLVRQPQQVEPLFRDLANQAHGKPGAGKRLPDDEFLAEAEVLSDAPHFVLEEIAQRFDELEIHPFGQPADVVVALDDHGGTEHGGGFDHVRIQRPLGEELDLRFAICDL